MENGCRQKVASKPNVSWLTWIPKLGWIQNSEKNLEFLFCLMLQFWSSEHLPLVRRFLTHEIQSMSVFHVFAQANEKEMMDGNMILFRKFALLWLFESRKIRIVIFIHFSKIPKIECKSYDMFAGYVNLEDCRDGGPLDSCFERTDPSLTFLEDGR